MDGSTLEIYKGKQYEYIFKNLEDLFTMQRNIGHTTIE